MPLFDHGQRHEHVIITSWLTKHKNMRHVWSPDKQLVWFVGHWSTTRRCSQNILALCQWQYRHVGHCILTVSPPIYPCLSHGHAHPRVYTYFQYYCFNFILKNIKCSFSIIFFQIYLYLGINLPLPRKLFWLEKLSLFGLNSIVTLIRKLKLTDRLNF